MKKTVSMLAAALISVLAVTGCSSSDSEEEAFLSLFEDAEYEIITGEYTLDECIELPEYSSIELTRTVYNISDEYIESYINSLADTEPVDDENAVVEEGDIANIAYEGTIDGETFDGGSSDSYDLTIGSGLFIDGFEDGLIGLKAGEETDLELVFPEDYYYTDYAGKEVVFHVTINSISRTIPQDDAWVSEYTAGEYETMEDYREYMKEYLEQIYSEQSESTLLSEAWEAVVDGTAFLKIPQSYLETGSSIYYITVEQEAEFYGYTSVEDYLDAMGVSDEVYDASMADYCDSYAKERLIGETILNIEGIALDGEEINSFYEEVAQVYGISIDELFEQIDENILYLYAVCTVANDVIVEYASISETTEII